MVILKQIAAASDPAEGVAVFALDDCGRPWEYGYFVTVRRGDCNAMYPHGRPIYEMSWRLVTRNGLD